MSVFASGTGASDVEGCPQGRRARQQLAAKRWAAAERVRANSEPRNVAARAAGRPQITQANTALTQLVGQLHPYPPMLRIVVVEAVAQVLDPTQPAAFVGEQEPAPRRVGQHKIIQAQKGLRRPQIHFASRISLARIRPMQRQSGLRLQLLPQLLDHRKTRQTASKSLRRRFSNIFWPKIEVCGGETQ